MTPDTPKDNLKESIERFEEAILTPIVSGDLAAWMQTVGSVWAETSTQVRLHICELHPRQYEEISQQDPEMLSRVELLTAEDAALEKQREKLNETVVRLEEHMPRFEPNEEKAHAPTQRLIDEALGLIAGVRKQKVAVQTWYNEAFQRDRGAVD